MENNTQRLVVSPNLKFMILVYNHTKFMIESSDDPTEELQEFLHEFRPLMEEHAAQDGIDLGQAEVQTIAAHRKMVEECQSQMIRKLQPKKPEDKDDVDPGLAQP